MTDAEDRVAAFLDWWVDNADRFALDLALDSCDPPHPVEDDPDVLVAEYVPEVHRLLASDVRRVLAELKSWREAYWVATGVRRPT